MALVKCKECGHEVSQKAKSCPQCGVANPATKPIHYIAAIGIIAALVAFAVTSGDKYGETKNQKNTPDHDARLTKTVVVMKLLKTTLREPGSLQFDQAIASLDADTICIRYRAKNGFGGTNVEMLVIDKDQHGTTQSFWDAHCKNATYSVLDAQHLL